MKKFEDVDIIDSLRRIMNTNTQYYRSDFVYDVKILQDVAECDKSQDRRLLFMSRPHGTYCFREKEVFKKDSAAYTTWNYYGEQSNDKILAYAVHVTGIVGDKIRGNIYELDYQQHYRHVTQTAVNADIQTIHYKHGDVDMTAGKYFPPGPHPKYGDFIDAEVKPNDSHELRCVLADEHHAYDKLPPGDIDKHIEDLTKSVVRERLKAMSAKEKTALIEKIETGSSYHDMGEITQLDFALYKAVKEQQEKEKPSIRRQLAENKSEQPVRKLPNKNKSLEVR